MCFGIELKMNGVAAKYFYMYHGLSPQISGLCASCWGLMNIIARSIGGWISDWANDKCGMRGRLWACWVVQTLEGMFCILLGLVTLGFDAPHKSSVGGQTIDAWTYIPDDPARVAGGLPNGWVNMAVTCGEKRYNGTVPLTIMACNTLKTNVDDGLRKCLKLSEDVDVILRKTAPPEFGGPADLNCVSNSGTVGQVMMLVIFFSLCVQAAEGLHYGIVPYVSRPALGVVSGMVGAGGNTGAVVAGRLFFTGAFRTDQAIIYMGIMIIGLTALLFLVYFPELGCMLLPAKALGGYDPQCIKPPADYRGADAMDYEAAKKKVAAEKAAGQPEAMQSAEVTMSKA
jgi:hypothetical protein